MPKEVRMTTHSRFSGSGPKNEAKAPGMEETASSSTWASFSTEERKPPFWLSTARMTATMPTSMMMPWIKSLMAVAM